MRVSNFAASMGRTSRPLTAHLSPERRRTNATRAATTRQKLSSSVVITRCSSSSSSSDSRASFVAAPPTRINPEDGSVSIPTRLSGTPMSREARRWFYEDAASSVDAALGSDESGGKKKKKKAKRASVKLMVPETNPEQDTFRVGTLLELVRAIAVRRARKHRERVRVVVQGPLGEGFFKGMPLSLSGVSSLLSRMDWGEEGESEDSEGQSASSRLITTGILGGGAEGSSDEAILGSPPCDLLVVVAPQNIVGGSVMPDLMASAQAAERQGASVVLVNSILKDVQSSGGVMSVRGRDERLADAATFVPAYHLRLLFANPTMPFPIRGVLRLSWVMSEGQEQPEWQVYSREDVTALPSTSEEEEEEASSSSSSSAAAALAAPLPWSQRETFILSGSLPLDLEKEKGGEPSSTEITAFLRERRERVAAAERAVRESGGGGGGDEKKKGWWW